MILGDQTFAGGERHRVIHIIGDLVGGHGHMPGPRVKGDKAQAQALQLIEDFLAAGVGHLHLVALKLGDFRAQLVDQIVAVEHVHFPAVDLVGQPGALFLQALLQGQFVLLGQALHLAALLRVAAGVFFQAAVERLHLRLERAVLLAQRRVLGFQRFELHQHLFQLGAENLFLLLLGIAELGHLLFLPGFQGVDAQPQFLDGARQTHPLLVVVLAPGAVGGSHRGHVLAGQGGHRRRRRRQVLVHFQAHLRAPAAQQIPGRHEIIGAGLHHRVPKLVLVPGHRALAAAGQTNRAGAHVRARAAVFRQVSQGHVPGGVGHAVGVEIDQKQHHGLGPQPAVDQAIGAAHFLTGKLGHPHHAVQNGFEIGVQHAFADALLAIEQHRFGGH